MVETPLATRIAYAILTTLATLTSVGIWVLMVFDEERGVGEATVQMVVKFTNVTIVLVAAVAAWIASAGPPSRGRAIAHLTVTLMAVVTAVVNATMLDPGLPGGWWGVVDLSQHYLIPAAVIVAWATFGPSFDLQPSRLASVLLVPLGWFVFVLVRGELTDSYPYDIVDPTESGWGSVILAAAAILVFTVVLGVLFEMLDRRTRHHRLRPSRRRWRDGPVAHS